MSNEKQSAEDNSDYLFIRKWYNKLDPDGDFEFMCATQPENYEGLVAMLHDYHATQSHNAELSEGKQLERDQYIQNMLDLLGDKQSEIERLKIEINLLTEILEA